MRQINFLMIFVFCLTLVLFSLENTEPATIQLVKYHVQAPLSVELILAMGVGAVLAWMFSVWTGLQRRLATRGEIRQRDARIQELEQDIEQYKSEVQAQQLTLPAAKDNLHQEAQAA
ncbi:MAG: LapA family protein [Chroococcidiopsidaceae cyanobacterium CP_BM_ER_R8_30]|nr:LapA family protein [Chroococcidiopsidaceae cyanobacterium CP_BM_ER_R8_30]